MNILDILSTRELEPRLKRAELEVKNVRSTRFEKLQGDELFHLLATLGEHLALKLAQSGEALVTDRHVHSLNTAQVELLAHLCGHELDISNLRERAALGVVVVVRLGFVQFPV